MKKNYFYPETETVQLKGCSIMQTGNTSGTTPMDDAPGDGWDAPSRKGLYM